MASLRFRLPIGAKRQITLPRALMALLSLEEDDELLVEVVGDQAVLTPVVSIPRAALPEELRRKFESRGGRKSSDIPLSEFLSELDSAGAAKGNLARTGEAIETAEEAVVSKSPHIAEEIVVGKTGSDRVETVHDTVRRQQVEVQRVPPTPGRRKR